MGHALARRGPDDAQYFDDGTLALVYRRLAIFDVEGGRQPFFNEAGDQLLVANGEIYNHAELRSALARSHRFGSGSDCEPLLHGFEDWGTGVLPRTRGMFALAHWDLKQRVLTLARDRLGIKPLYVCRLRDGLLFGSELKALLAHPECPREIAWQDIDRQPVSQPCSASYVRGVELLAGGECLRIDGQGRLRAETWWRLQDHFGAAPFGDRAAAYVDAYAELLRETTVQHLQREVGAGIHLSGGVDSSLLAAIVARHDRDMPCFTVVERSSYLEGDVGAARQLTQRLGLPWMPVRFDHRTVVADIGMDLPRLEEAVWMMDSPRFEIEWLFKEELHRTARRCVPGLKVVLLGQGADEFAGGYSRRVDAMRHDWGDYLRSEVQPNLAFDAAVAGGASVNYWQLARATPDHAGLSPYHRFMALMLRQLQHHNLWHEDRTSAWQSLEARVPFLDHKLVELLASVPEPLQARLFWNKQIVRSALERHAPGHALRQPKLAFLDGSDPGSLDVIQHGLLRAVAADFRDKYLGEEGGPFDRHKLAQLIDRALSRGPQRAAAMREALHCIAITIFVRQLRQPWDEALGGDRPALRLMTEADWQGWQRDMPAPPLCRRVWEPAERVVFVQGVEVTFHGAPTGCMRFHRDGTLAGEVTPGAADGWAETFVRNLGSEAAAGFTVQDWLDEFEIPLERFAQLLDMLYHLGVLGAVDPSVAGDPAEHPTLSLTTLV